MKIAHLADLHLGYRAYHRVTARGVNAREADVSGAFRQAIERVIALAPDLVLVAGDVFHTVRPSNTAIADAFRQFSLLAVSLPDVPVVVIAGNHDSPRSSDTGNILTLFREIPGVVVVAEEVSAVRLEAIDTSVLCLPHNALTEASETVLEPDPRARHNVMMLHGTVGGSVAEQKLRYVSEYGGAMVHDTQIGPQRWEYVALGHYHIATELAPNMWYAGGIERTSTNIWLEAGGPKGFLLYDTDTSRITFYPLDTRVVVDLPRFSARGMTAVEVDETIRTAVDGIAGGVAGKIVRQVITDLDRQRVRDLNHRRIREWKAEALHFHVDARPPEVRRVSASGAPLRRQTLDEQVENYLLRDWEPTSPLIQRERLVTLGKQYLQQTGQDA